MPLSRIALRLGAVLVLAACASTGGSRTSSSGGSNGAVISSELLRTEGGKSLHDVIRQHRPQWLTRRGMTSINNEGGIVVYVDGNRMGGLEVLRNIAAETVESARHLSAGEATTRFGTGHAHGAIVIVTRRS